MYQYSYLSAFYTQLVMRIIMNKILKEQHCDMQAIGHQIPLRVFECVCLFLLFGHSATKSSDI